MSYYRRGGKHLIDRIFAAIALILVAPILGIVALSIRWTMGKPVLFRQERIGYKEQPFHVLKFRTMSTSMDQSGNLLPDENRITPLGTFLRRSSLDELPQLWNILRGEMSFVGPRPLYCDYLPYYSERERVRHTVRPGVTGLAQINGRNMLEWDDRLEMDAVYVEEMSFINDVRIVWSTAVKVFRREGIVVIPGGMLGRLDDVRA